MKDKRLSAIAVFLDEAHQILEDTVRLTENNESDYVRRLLYKGSERAELARQAREACARDGQNFLAVRASLEFSNHCRQKCSFCGMNAMNKQLERYRMTFDQIKRVIDDVAALGITEMHFASGEDWAYDSSTFESVIKYAASQGLEATLVTSHRKPEDYERWRSAGASRYILKVETTNESLFHQARTGTILRERIAHLLFLRSIGYKIGTGVICGLPGQTPKDLAKDLTFLCRLKPDMASVSRFLPNEQSLFQLERAGDTNLTLNFISLIRLEVKSSGLRIPAGTTFGARQSEAIFHGANVVSLHVTPTEYADLYSADRIKERHLTQMQTLERLSEETNLPLHLRA